MVWNDQQFEDLLAAELSRGVVHPFRMVPALWAWPVRGEVDVDHIHLPMSGKLITGRLARVSDVDNRIDMGMTCGDIARVVMMKAFMGDVLLVCLN